MKQILYIYIYFLVLSLLSGSTPWNYTLSLGSGYDSNVLRLSSTEISNAGQNPELLGSSQNFDSFVTKYGFSLKKDLWVNNNKNLLFGSKFSNSNYAHTPEKRHWSGAIQITYKWGSYKNLKYSLQHLDKFYLRHYINRDIGNNELEACYFSDRNNSISLTHRISQRSWGALGVGFLQRYYNQPFTEFDLDITYLKIRLNFKFNKLGTLAFQINQGRAISESHLGVARPSSFDRSYNTQELFIPFILKHRLPFIQSMGISYRSEKRVYDAEDPNDVLHAGRSHVDRKLGLWIKKGIGEDLSLKLSTRLRSRETDSQYRWVRNLKSFHQLQFWLNIEWDLLYDKY